MDVSNALNYFKFKYHDCLAKRLNDPKAAAKTYWLIMKIFVNGSNSPDTAAISWKSTCY